MGMTIIIVVIGDPNTKLLYIVRDDYLINATINCFSIDDNAEIIDGLTKYKWLK